MKDLFNQHRNETIVKVDAMYKKLKEGTPLPETIITPDPNIAELNIFKQEITLNLKKIQTEFNIKLLELSVKQEELEGN